MSAPAADKPFRGPLKVEYCSVCSMPPEYCEFGPSWDRCKVLLEKTHPDLLAAALAKMTVSGGAPAGAAAAAAASSTAQSAEAAATKKKAKKAAAGSDDEDEDDDDEDESDDEAPAPAAAAAAAGDDDEFLAAAAPVKAPAPKKSAAPAAPGIYLFLSQRSKKKFVTTARGWESFGLTLKDVSKLLAKKFATAASVVKQEGNGATPGGHEIAMQGDLLQDLPYWIVEEFKQIDKKQVWSVDKAGKKIKAF